MAMLGGLPKEVAEGLYLTGALFVLGLISGYVPVSFVQIPTVTLGTAVALILAVYVKDFLKKQLKL